MTKTVPSRALHFGAFEVDLRSGELRKKGIKVKLQEKPFQILALLLEHAGEVVTREELRQQLWSSDIIVDFDHSLGTAIGKLRQSLGDTAQNPRFVETLSNRGYRFIAPVSAVEEGAGSPPQNSTPEDVVPSVSAFELAIPATLPPVARSWRWRIAAVVAILLLGVGIGWFVWRQTPPTPPAGLKRIESLAVLPLVNVSGEQEQEYFVDGMTDELITELAKIGSLRVISRTSSMRYKASGKSLAEIAGELNVDAVVEGTVLRSAGGVRITAQLIHAATDRHLWAESYERDLRDVMALQDEVAREIANHIQVKLTPQEKARLTGARPISPAAHEAYLKGRFYWIKFTEDGFRKSIEYFKQAVERDPTYGLAYSGLADSYSLLGEITSAPPKEVFPQARAYAEKALELDEAYAEAHLSLGIVKLFYDWDLVGAEKELRRAKELDPNNPQVYHFYGHYLQIMGRAEDAVGETKRGVELDPISLIVNAELGEAYSLARQFDQAITQFRKTLELDPSFVFASWCIAQAYEQLGRNQEALAELSRARGISADWSWIIAELGCVYAALGQRAEAQKIIQELSERAKREHIDPVLISYIYIALGDNDQAFVWLEKARQERAGQISWLKVEPKFDPLRSDPRFTELLRRLGFPA